MTGECQLPTSTKLTVWQERSKMVANCAHRQDGVVVRARLNEHSE